MHEKTNNARGGIQSLLRMLNVISRLVSL